MENAKISNLYDLDETIAKEYLGCKECKSGTDSMFKRSADH